MWHCRIFWLTAPLWSGITAFLPTNVDRMEAMKILAMNLKFDNDNIDDPQKHELFKHAGYNDYQLYMNQAITKDMYIESVRKTFKDEIVTSILEQGGIDIGEPIWRKLFFDEDPDKIFAEMVGVQEPLKSIIRLVKSDDDDRSEYGQKLLKKLQYKSFNNPNGGVFEQNLDHFMLEDSEGRKNLVKDILTEEWFKNVEDPLQAAILKLWHKSRDLEGAEKELAKQNIKDLQYIQMFEDSLPEFTPVRQEDLYLFYKMTDGRIEASDLINVAMGSEIGPITANDFEFYFGSSAKEFTCRAHDPSIQIPCGIKLKPNECYKAGCCYDDVTGCYQNLYGKIGSSVARKLLIDNNADTNAYIQNLFQTAGVAEDRIPPLDLILRELNELPYGVNLHTKNGAFEYENAGLHAVQYTDGNFNWWDQSTLAGDDFFKDGPNGKSRESIVLNQKQERKKYGRQGFEWKPHGPTASPIFNKIPGLNPTADPLSNGLTNLNDYYGKWLSFADAHDDYACSLIPKSSRTTCMRNFEALIDKVDATNLCADAGCCFSEEAFLKGEDACYRAADYGTCNPRYFEDFDGPHPGPPLHRKTECGWDGITETECLTNVKCCYQPTGKVGVPWCYHKASATLDSGEGWCEAWTDPKYRDTPRAACFVTDIAKKNLFNDDETSDINNLVNQDQCESAGCCFDSSIDVKDIDFLTGGLGLASTPLRCFKKSNPFITQTINGGVIGGGRFDLDGERVNSNYDLQDADYNYAALPGGPDAFGATVYENYELLHRQVFTCDERDWTEQFKYKRSCGENLTYYQCVYVNKCCYRPNFLNQPACYKPELKRGAP